MLQNMYKFQPFRVLFERVMLFPQQFLPQRETKGRRDRRRFVTRKNNAVETVRRNSIILFENTMEFTT